MNECSDCWVLFMYSPHVMCSSMGLASHFFSLSSTSSVDFPDLTGDGPYVELQFIISPSLWIVSGCGSLYLLPSAAGWGLSGDDWTRYQFISIAEYHYESSLISLLYPRSLGYPVSSSWSPGSGWYEFHLWVWASTQTRHCLATPTSFVAGHHFRLKPLWL